MKGDEFCQASLDKRDGKLSQALDANCQLPIRGQPS